MSDVENESPQSSSVLLLQQLLREARVCVSYKESFVDLATCVNQHIDDRVAVQEGIPSARWAREDVHTEVFKTEVVVGLLESRKAQSGASACKTWAVDSGRLSEWAGADLAGTVRALNRRMSQQEGAWHVTMDAARLGHPAAEVECCTVHHAAST